MLLNKISNFLRRRTVGCLSECPTISVIVPNFNHGCYLEQNIKGVLKQTYPHWEMIIIDDASTDASREVISRWSTLDARIKPIFLEKNHGAVAALSRGLASAQGELVYGSAADDYISNEFFFSHAVKAISTFSCSGFFGQTELVDGKTSKHLMNIGHAKSEGLVSNRFALKQFLKGKIFVPGSSAIWRRDLLVQYQGFDEDLGPQADWFLNHALPITHGVVFSRQCFSVMRVFASSYGNAADDDSYFKRHALGFAKLCALDLPFQPSPKEVSAWKEKLIQNRLRSQLAFRFIVSVLHFLSSLKPSEAIDLPPEVKRILENVHQLEASYQSRLFRARVLMQDSDAKFH